MVPDHEAGTGGHRSVDPALVVLGVEVLGDRAFLVRLVVLAWLDRR